MKKRILHTLIFMLLSLSSHAEIELIPIINDSKLRSEEQRLIEAAQQNKASLNSLAAFYAQHRYYSKAVELLEGIIGQEPQNDEAYFLLGKLWGSQKSNPDQALQMLHKAVELKPKHIAYREELVNVYHRLQRFPPALEQLESILQLEPNNKDALYRKAVILYTQGRVDEAARMVDLLLNDEHALVLKSIILIQNGENAQEVLEHTVTQFPENVRARYELAKIWMKQKKWDKAQTAFEQIIDEDPFYQHALFQLVKIYSIQKEKEKAQFAKQSLDTINRMGRDQRNFYRSYLRHHPDTAATHFEMGLIYLEIGRGDLAAEQMRVTMERDSQHIDAAFYLAQIYMSSGEFGRAVPVLKKCVELRENKAVIHSLLSQCYLQLKDVANAKKHLQSALQLNPKEPLALRIIEFINQNKN